MMTRSIHRPLAAALRAAFIGGALSGTAAHAAWDVVPDVALTSEVDDNARLVLGDQPSSSRTALDGRLRLRAYSPRGEAFIEPRIVTDAYANERDDDLESDDTFLLARAVYNFQKGTRIEFQSDYRRESVLRSEFGDVLDPGPDLGGETIDTGAGRLQTFTDERERLDLGFNAQFKLSERTNFRLETSRIDVAYPDSVATTRSPFDDTTVGAVLTRLVDQRNEVSARMYVSDFHADRNDNDTRAFGVEGSFKRPLSQTWTLELNAGVARRDYTFIDGATLVDNADSNFTFGTDITKRSDLTQWTIGVGRSLNPNSNGFLAQRDDVTFRVRRQFRPRLAATVGVRASQVDAADNAAAGNDGDYWRASLAVEWAMTPRWRLTTGLDRVTDKFAGPGTPDATSNAVSVGIRYQGLSRGNR